MGQVDAISATQFGVGYSSNPPGSIAVWRRRVTCCFELSTVDAVASAPIGNGLVWLADAPRPLQHWSIPCGLPLRRFGFEAAGFVRLTTELARHALRVLPSMLESTPDARLRQLFLPSMKAGGTLEQKLGNYPMIVPLPTTRKQVRGQVRRSGL